MRSWESSHLSVSEDIPLVPLSVTMLVHLSLIPESTGEVNSTMCFKPPLLNVLKNRHVKWKRWVWLPCPSPFMHGQWCDDWETRKEFEWLTNCHPSVTVSYILWKNKMDRLPNSFGLSEMESAFPLSGLYPLSLKGWSPLDWNQEAYEQRLAPPLSWTSHWNLICFIFWRIRIITSESYHYFEK